MPDFKLIFDILDSREKKQLGFIFLLILAMGFIELIGVGSIGPFMAILSNAGMIHSNVYLEKVYSFLHFSSDTQFIITFGIAVVIILALSNLSLAFIHYVLYSYTGKRNHSISMRLFEKYLKQRYTFFLNINAASITQQILTEVNNFISNILLNVLNLIASLVISVAVVILLIIVNPFIALSVSAIFSLLYILIFYTIRKFLDRKGKERYALSVLRNKYVLETFGGIKDVKILGKEKIFLDLFSVPSKRVARSNAINDTVSELPKFLLETVAFGSIVGIIIIMIAMGRRIDDFLPSLTVYAFGAYRLLPNLQKIYRCFTGLRYHRATLDKLHRTLVELPEGVPLSNGIPRLDFHNSIRLENIAFSYPNAEKAEKRVIKNQSLHIKANTSVALVGSTGCGKTTFIDILLGLLEPQEGKIFIDDVEITNENRKNWQMNLGYVPQSIYLTDDTIRNNIAFGVAPDKINDKDVVNAAKIANIHDFVQNELERKYETVIGERGIRLSGGQRQRIGIARAVYHNPTVLILDEATSALDGVTEGAIMDAIKRIGHKKTIIMVAHRITTVRNCDVIYMMDKGVIVDSGNYEELYQKNEMFRKMADGL
ncbi:MAG: ABC transporter ATP-binding protein/permease [Treponema sp.]|jgi:ABC-type multidrug transport system fused ATPase/permease subunit|nr:ABC transporter ATP-binding protein/permease [Treponema sp.]